MKNLKFIIRSIIHPKLFTSLNIAGLSIGLICVIIISLWVLNEKGYDKFNHNFESIYRLEFNSKEGKTEMDGSPNPLAVAIEEEVSAVEFATRLRNAPEMAFKYKSNMFFENNGITADPQIFKIFSFKEIIGNAQKALEEANSIVITQSFAERYFGKEDPIGKQLLVEGEFNLTVNAVIEDVPAQSHIQFDYILPHKLGEAAHFCGLEWGDPNFIIYVLLKRDSNPLDAAKTITQVAKDRGMPHVKWGGMVSYLRPLSGVYLTYNIENQLGETGDYRYLYVFSSIALLILILACINYLNLTVSLFARKQKDTSIKKVCGAGNLTIFWNNFLESGIIVLISFFIALLITSSVYPSIKTFLNKPLGINLFDFEVSLVVIGLFVLTVLFCAIYPAILFSGPKAIALMNRYSKRKSNVLKGMVLFQNIIAVCLIIMVVGVSKQMNYLTDKDLGFQTNQIAYVKLRGQITNKLSVFKQSLLQNSGIVEITKKDCLPYGLRNSTSGLSWKTDGEWQNKSGDQVMETTRIDANYFDMMDVKFVEGRNFREDFAEDKKNFIVNEEAVRKMGLKNPIGTEFRLYDQFGIIVGVIKDTYFKSLYDKIKPQVFHLFKDEARESYFGILFFKIKGNTKEAITHVENSWTQINPGIPFEYHFLNSDYEKLYEKDIRNARMLNTFCVLAVFIACLGLFGQAAISGENKTKEIGIRKVNGARTNEVIAMLNRDFIKWVAIAFVIACPIAWYAMHKWLENFAYKTTLSWWVFAAAGVIALVIALVTVSWQSWRAATRNPVESLRYE